MGHLSPNRGSSRSSYWPNAGRYLFSPHTATALRMFLTTVAPEGAEPDPYAGRNRECHRLHSLSLRESSSWPARPSNGRLLRATSAATSGDHCPIWRKRFTLVFAPSVACRRVPRRFDALPRKVGGWGVDARVSLVPFTRRSYYRLKRAAWSPRPKPPSRSLPATLSTSAPRPVRLAQRKCDIPVRRTWRRERRGHMSA